MNAWLFPLEGGWRVLAWNTVIVAGCCGIAVTLAERSRERALRRAREAQARAELEERGEQLRASLARLREQERLVAVGTLAAGIAHQINNPIGGIAAAAQFALLAGEGPDRDAIRQDALETALEESRRCGRIVKSVLQFSRDEPTVKWVEDLNPTVHRASELVRSYVNHCGGQLVIALCEEPLPVRMSPIDIEQVVVNLIRNAAESRSDGARVEVRTERGRGEALLFVTDDGEGLDCETRSRLFEPFYTTRQEEGGSGLGLSVVHGVVGEHAGKLEVETLDGGSTRFGIHLPLEEYPTVG